MPDDPKPAPVKPTPAPAPAPAPAPQPQPAAQGAQAAPAPEPTAAYPEPGRRDFTRPGGAFIVEGRVVDANGAEIKDLAVKDGQIVEAAPKKQDEGK